MPTFDKLMQKVFQARQSGVPEGDITASLRRNAMRTRDANQRGALMNAALSSRDVTSANQAGLIQTAGLEGQAYQPQTGAGAAIGRGFAEAGEAEGQYQRDLSRIERDEQVRQDRLAKEEREREYEREKEGKKEAKKTESERVVLDKLYTSANEGIELLNRGWKGLLAYQQATLRANQIFGAAYLIPNVDTRGVETRQDAYVDAFLRNQVKNGTVGEAEMSAFTSFRAVTTELSASKLDSLGPGPKTDFDFIVAERTIANLEGTPQSIADSLKRVRRNAEKWLSKTGNKPPEASIPANVPAYNQNIEWEEPGEPEGGWLGDKWDQAKETLATGGGKLKTGFQAVFKGSGSGTPEDPYKVPSSKWRKAGALNWLEDQSLEGSEIITWKGITGTVNELIEYLQK